MPRRVGNNEKVMETDACWHQIPNAAMGKGTGQLPDQTPGDKNQNGSLGFINEREE